MRLPQIVRAALRLAVVCGLAGLGGLARAQDPGDAPGQGRDNKFGDHKTDYETPKRKHEGWILHHASKDTPEAQYAYAERLKEKGHPERAGKAFDDLVHVWHDSPQAASAQRQFADLLVVQGKPEKAFEEYQYLIRYFAGTFPYQEVLETQFKLANDVRTARHAKLIVFPGFQDPARAVPLYEQIVDNGPNWDHAPEAEFNVGAIQESTGDFDLAVVAYETLQMRYPRSDFIEEAAYRRAKCLYELSRQSPRSEDQCREALYAMLGYVRRHADNTHASEARLLAEELKQRLADMYYDRALFYDELAKRPASAVIAYSDFIAKFPTSERRATADARVVALQLQMERHHED